MNKYISIVLALLLLAGVSGCAGIHAAQQQNDEKLCVVTTIFPIYDWVREIVGEHTEEMEVTLLLDSGVDLHSFQPTAADMIRISTCDLFIYVGGESDEWVGDALAEAEAPDAIGLNLMETLGGALKQEELTEGMQADEEEETGEEGEIEYDEHIWLSLRNAGTLCRVIAERLAALDPDNAADYAANADAYISRLDELDAAYVRTVEAAQTRTLLFGDRFPFRYLADDYGLSYYAAFAGCSAETEASFETVVFLAGKVDELGLSVILKIDGADESIARTIRENTKTGDQRILSIDSMQSLTSRDIREGTTYLSVMEDNRAILEQALSVQG